MAKTFNNVTVTGITTEQTVYTCPSGTTTIILGTSIANTSGNATKANIKKGDAYIVKEAPIPAGGALTVEVKIVVKADDEIKVSADEAVDAIISVLEIS